MGSSFEQLILVSESFFPATGFCAQWAGLGSIFAHPEDRQAPQNLAEELRARTPFGRLFHRLLWPMMAKAMEKMMS